MTIPLPLSLRNRVHLARACADLYQPPPQTRVLLELLLRCAVDGALHEDSGTLAQTLHMSRRALTAAVGGLRDDGLLRVARPHGEPGQRVCWALDLDALHGVYCASLERRVAEADLDEDLAVVARHLIAWLGERPDRLALHFCCAWRAPDGPIRWPQLSSAMKRDVISHLLGAFSRLECPGPPVGAKLLHRAGEAGLFRLDAWSAYLTSGGEPWIDFVDVSLNTGTLRQKAARVHSEMAPAPTACRDLQRRLTQPGVGPWTYEERCVLMLLLDKGVAVGVPAGTVNPQDTVSDEDRRRLGRTLRTDDREALEALRSLIERGHLAVTPGRSDRERFVSVAEVAVRRAAETGLPLRLSRALAEAG